MTTRASGNVPATIIARIRFLILAFVGALSASIWKSPMRTTLLLLQLVVLSISTLTAQVAPGVPNFSAFDSHELDTVDLMNNNVLISIPIMSKSGAFPVNFGMFGNYYVFSTNAVWQTASTQVNTQLISATNGFISSNGLTANTPVPGVPCPGGGTTTKYTNWSVIEANGSQHRLAPGAYSDRTSGGPSCLSGSGFTAQAMDGSGLTVTVAANGTGATSIFARNGMLLGTSLIMDSNSNKLILSAGTITDTLGLAAVTATSPTLGPFSWTDVYGNTQQATVSTTSPKLETAFGCSGIGEINNSFTTTLASGLQFPDSTSVGITYETTPGHSPNVTGRINKITLREGGTVTYTYGGSNNGINCTYQTVPVLTRTLGNNDKTTYTLAYSIIGSGPAYQATNTVIDPGGNKTVYTFTGFNSTGVNVGTSQLLTQVQRYQGTATLLTTDVYCYDGVTSTCPTNTMAAGPITEVDVYHTINGMSTSSRTQTLYDIYGNVTYSAQYGFGGTTPTKAITTTYGSWNGTTCVSIGNNVTNKPCDVLTTQNGNNVAESHLTYDYHGSLLMTALWTGSYWLGQWTANSYNSNGTPIATYDVSNISTTYAYNGAFYAHCGSCTQYPFPTSISKDGLTNNSTWDGWGGVKLTDVDANGNTTTFGYVDSKGGADPFWRVRMVTDPYGTTNWKDYSATGKTDYILFNSSVMNPVTSTDAYGRLSDNQLMTGPGTSVYDTVTTSYGWSGNYSTVSTSQPCDVALGGTCAAAHQRFLDPLGRLASASTTGNETLTNTFANQDVVTEEGPAASGEHTKKVQTEYDGLGRVSKICKIQLSGGTSCGQATGTSVGIVDSYSYGQGTGYTTVSITRGIQTRSETFDAMGRLTQKVTPEGGSWHYAYDTGVSGCSWSNGNMGMLSKVTDPNGNTLCYVYDYLNRVITVNANGTSCRHYYYDNSTGYSGTIPTGITLANQYGRMVEAATDDCSGSNLLTDEWIAYDKDGRVTDIWQMTPHSGGWYHSTASYFANGQLSSLTLPGLGTTAYTLEGEGRLYSAKLGTVTLVPSVAYGLVGPTTIKVGSGTDQDTYSYSSTTGRMTNFQFNVGTKNAAGTLNWNPNGTLGSLAMVDGFNSINTQTCTYLYDDVTRLVSDQCGSPWAQTFSYDQYDNLNQFGNDPFTFTYDLTTNRYSVTGVTYDASGDLTYDGTNTYTYNAMNKLASVAPYGYTCASNSTAACFTYDAFGRVVEKQSSSGYSETLYSPAGKSAAMSGQTLSYAFIPLPGGSFALTSGSSQFYYTHGDWLGTIRVASTIPASGNGTMFYDRSFAPYSQMYGNNGTAGTGSQFFTGDTHLSSGLFDTPNRELNQSQGRWLTPDPAHSGWNKYAYPTNPNSFSDPSGLEPAYCKTARPMGQSGCSGNYGSDPGVDDGSASVGCSDLCGGTSGSSGSGTVPADSGYEPPGWNGGQQQDWTPGTGSDESSSDTNGDDVLALILSAFQKGCTGAGIPCRLQGTWVPIGERSGLLSHTPGGPPLQAHTYQYAYTVVDVNGDTIIGGVVTEWLQDATSPTSDRSQGDSFGDSLGGVFGRFIDNVGFGPEPGSFFLNQTFTVQLGGISYALTTQNSMFAVSAGQGNIYVNVKNTNP
jgi:RHS repeat-associated protein